MAMDGCDVGTGRMHVQLCRQPRDHKHCFLTADARKMRHLDSCYGLRVLGSLMDPQQPLGPALPDRAHHFEIINFAIRRGAELGAAAVATGADVRPVGLDAVVAPPLVDDNADGAEIDPPRDAADAPPEAQRMYIDLIEHLDSFDDKLLVAIETASTRWRCCARPK